jgi:hypothetical protein
MLDGTRKGNSLFQAGQWDGVLHAVVPLPVGCGCRLCWRVEGIVRRFSVLKITLSFEMLCGGLPGQKWGRVRGFQRTLAAAALRFADDDTPRLQPSASSHSLTSLSTVEGPFNRP